eukprot:Skav226019  [mRNA]  locus=scaffold1010:331489:332181:+ [translate_table: standard]
MTRSMGRRWILYLCGLHPFLWARTSRIPNEENTTDSSRAQTLDVLCNSHWTWSGVANFWTIVYKSNSTISWSITRSNDAHKESAQWSRGQACSGSQIREGTAVVVVGSNDRFSRNVWHQMTAIFEAWVTPKVLQILHVLPPNISLSYKVPDTFDASLTRNSGVFPWQMLGPTTSEQCGFEHVITAPRDGFLWDLAWDLPLRCAQSPNLWRDFQMAPRLKFWTLLTFAKSI